MACGKVTWRGQLWAVTYFKTLVDGGGPYVAFNFVDSGQLVGCGYGI